MKLKIFSFIYLMLSLTCMSSPIKSMVSFKQQSIDNTEVSYDSSSYIQDGLIEMFDGIDNAGYGMHNDNATKWIGLANGIELSFDAYAFVDGNSICNAPSRNMVAFATDSSPSFSEYMMSLPEFTIEICEDATHPDDNLYVWSNQLISFENIYQSGSRIYLQTHYNRALAYGCFGSVSITGYFDLHNLSFIVDQQNGIAMAYKDCNVAYSTFVSYQPTSISPFQVGIVNKIYCIRVYNRKLSQKEIIYNYYIDKMRFNLP